MQAFPLSDVKAYMGHADISTTMVYVHHVPQVDAAERLSAVVAGEDFLSRTLSRNERTERTESQSPERKKAA